MRLSNQRASVLRLIPFPVLLQSHIESRGCLFIVEAWRIDVRRAKKFLISTCMCDEFSYIHLVALVDICFLSPVGFLFQLCFFPFVFP